MRVITGEARGFRLKGPAGPFTRPMSDKIKGALFSMLASLGVEPERMAKVFRRRTGWLTERPETQDYLARPRGSRARTKS